MYKYRSIFLYPFSLIYGVITDIRNFLYDSGVLRSHEFSLPVICVGNLAAGGTGKTPHAEYLIELLRKEFRVALLSRGYRRGKSGFIVAGSESGVSDIGDEPLQVHKKYPDIMVAVESNRVNGIRNILKVQPDVNVIILDDGYQHRRITPGFSILLSDYSRMMIHDKMLPYGNLRESSRNMRRADVIIITKCPGTLSAIQRRIVVKEICKAPYQDLYFTSITYKNPVPVFAGTLPEGNSLSLPTDGSTGVVLVTGIASNEPLIDYVRARTSELLVLSFGDHHRYTVRDIEKIKVLLGSLGSRQKYVLTTEKDAMRLKEFANIAEPFRSQFFYIPVGIHFLNDDQHDFDNLITDYVRKNKRNNRIS